MESGASFATRDLAYTDWDDTEGKPPQEVALPPDE
jgi:hypothetical protein